MESSMIKCIIVDDEQHAIDVLKLHISKVPLLDLIFTTTQPLEAFQYLQNEKVDLIFLDIQMPELNGLQFLKLLHLKTKVILTTAYREHALEGFEHEVTDYLLKPVLFDRFLKAVQKVIAAARVQEQGHPSSPVQPAKEFLFVKTGIRNRIQKIAIREIEYIESKGNYIIFTLPNEKVITLLSLKEMEAELPASEFIRIHHSYIVALNKISSLEGNSIQLGKHQLPIGDTYKKNILDLLHHHTIQKK